MPGNQFNDQLETPGQSFNATEEIGGRMGLVKSKEFLKFPYIKRFLKIIHQYLRLHSLPVMTTSFSFARALI